MVKLLKETAERVGPYGWARFVAGLAILGGMLFYDLHLAREVEVILYAFPAYLLGMDLTKILKK